jgi:hypothetical protein
MARAHVEHIHAPEIEAQQLSWPGWPSEATVKILSCDDESGALTALLSLPRGYGRPQGSVVADTELLILSGRLAIGGSVLGRLSYRYTPPSVAEPAWEAGEDTELLFMTRTGGPELNADADPVGAPGAVTLDGNDLPWGPSPIANGPPNSMVAMLRRDPDSGEMTALARGRPRSHPVYEFHDCIEECFLIEGDITIGPGGEMRPGTYFWRPPYYTHGQARSETGSLLYVYTDSELINHFTDRMDRTPEENRAQVMRESQGR